MEDNVKMLIKKDADRIRESLVSDGMVGYLYGEPLDMSDPDSVLVAAVAKLTIQLYDDRVSRFQDALNA
jgi:hypothetical protein